MASKMREWWLVKDLLPEHLGGTRFLFNKPYWWDVIDGRLVLTPGFAPRDTMTESIPLAVGPFDISYEGVARV